jgi:hypothetical protein
VNGNGQVIGGVGSQCVASSGAALDLPFTVAADGEAVTLVINYASGGGLVIQDEQFKCIGGACMENTSAP